MNFTVDRSNLMNRLLRTNGPPMNADERRSAILFFYREAMRGSSAAKFSVVFQHSASVLSENFVE
jgi:hypothetical protein